MINMLNNIYKDINAENRRTSLSIKQYSKNKRTIKRGTLKYFLYIKERYGDIYCFINKSYSYLGVKDGFSNEDLVKSDKDLKNILNYIKSISKEKNKKITFSLNSYKIN